MGLLLSVYNALVSISKYLQFRKSNSVTIRRSHEVPFPTFLLCPYETGYNATYLESINITNWRDYEYGNWFGNSTLSPEIIFHKAAILPSNYVEKFSILYQNGSKKAMNISKVSNFYSPDGLGMCEELLIEVDPNLRGISLLLNAQTVIYFEPIGVKIDDDWSIVLPVAGKIIYQNVNYEIYNYIPEKGSCQIYSDTQTYDMCNFGELERLFAEQIGCSVPYVNSSVPVCTRKEDIEKVNSLYLQTVYYGYEEICEDSCLQMYFTYGNPDYDDLDDKNLYEVELYLKSKVKVTNDEVPYTFLGMIADIGGTAGILIGFSVIDFVVNCESFYFILRRK